MNLVFIFIFWVFFFFFKERVSVGPYPEVLRCTYYSWLFLALCSGAPPGSVVWSEPLLAIRRPYAVSQIESVVVNARRVL